MENYFCLCIINSQYDIPKLVKFLKNQKEESEVLGPIRKDFVRNRKTKQYFETGKKICLISTNLFDKLYERFSRGSLFSIDLYRIKSEHQIVEGESVYHMYYPLCSDINCNAIISEKLHKLVKIGFLSIGKWKIHENEGVCEFSPDVSEEKRIMIKIMCDYPEDFRVSWCRTFLYEKLVKKFS